MYQLIGQLMERGLVVCYVGRDPTGKPVRLSLDNIILLTSAGQIARAKDINIVEAALAKDTKS